MQHSRTESGDPIKVETTPPLTRWSFDGAYNELDAWWGTVNDPNWL